MMIVSGNVSGSPRKYCCELSGGESSFGRDSGEPGLTWTTEIQRLCGCQLLLVSGTSSWIRDAAACFEITATISTLYSRPALLKVKRILSLVKSFGTRSLSLPPVKVQVLCPLKGATSPRTGCQSSSVPALRTNCTRRSFRLRIIARNGREPCLQRLKKGMPVIGRRTWSRICTSQLRICAPADTSTGPTLSGSSRYSPCCMPATCPSTYVTCSCSRGWHDLRWRCVATTADGARSISEQIGISRKVKAPLVHTPGHCEAVGNGETLTVSVFAAVDAPLCVGGGTRST
mmetsp:Transcript_1251/g.3739  ORF Transcript_1251/g.3739 Transcript_1251/m.3739 type:complete len:288 (-) Transcript_1251:1495-2358(-)